MRIVQSVISNHIFRSAKQCFAERICFFSTCDSLSASHHAAVTRGDCCRLVGTKIWSTKPIYKACGLLSNFICVRSLSTHRRDGDGFLHISRDSHDDVFPSDIDDKSDLVAWSSDQAKHVYRPKIDPQLTSFLLFPGQGTQFIGMGNKLLKYPGVEDIYKEASAVLKYNLLDVCLKGPKAKLDRTVYSQPAIFVTSIAAIVKMKHENPQAIEQCVMTAGYSIGEYAALVFSGALEFEDALRLVQARAEGMQHASEQASSGMLTVTLTAGAKLGEACKLAREYCKEQHNIAAPVCQVASHLYTEAKVIAGHTEALAFVSANKSEFGIRSTHPIPVSGAFHTPLMKPAVPILQDALKTVSLQEPIVNVHSNVTAHKYKQTRVIKEFLIKQLTAPVKWEQLMHAAYSRPGGEDFPVTWEVGPGKQLGLFLRKTNSKAFARYKNVDV